MNLELKHLAPYLPYRLKYSVFNKKGKLDLLEIGTNNIYNIITAVNKGVYGGEYKPILRPLSDLTKSELIELRFDEGNDTLLWSANNVESYKDFIQFYETDLTYSVLVWAYKKHLDIFGLIEKGLAIDINTIFRILRNEQ